MKKGAKIDKISDLVTISEASNMLGVSKLTLRNWDKVGQLEAVRVGTRGDRRYRRTDIEKLASGDEVESIDMKKFMSYIQTHTFWKEEAPALPITLEMGVKKMVETQQYFTPGFTYCIFHYENDYMWQYLSVEESIYACRSHIQAVKHDPARAALFIEACRNAFKTFDKVITKYAYLELSQLSNDDLNKHFIQFQKALGEFWGVTLVVEPYSPYLDEEYVPLFEKKSKNPSLAREAFATLTLPKDLSFISSEHRDLLSFVTKYLAKKSERDLLLASSNAEYLAHLTHDMPECMRALENHQRQYYWIQKGYGQLHVLTVHHFLNTIRSTLFEHTIQQLEAELTELQLRTRFLNEQQSYLRRLELSQDTLAELDFLRTVVWIKDERKSFALKMVHVIFSFVAEYARRTGVSFELASYALTEEFPKLLAKEIGVGILEQRRERSFLVSEHGNKSSMIAGNEAVIIKEILAIPHGALRHEIFQGSVACKGGSDVIRGKVRIILNPKGATIADDEILVTSMTRPEFVSLMRKAKAVITDEGGITSHAAIVSREMNKPCVIGTKFATKLLKDGDTVEMKMNHGAIRIL